MKNLEIQANFKINFLRRNGKMARLNNFQAFKGKLEIGIFTNLNGSRY